MTCSGPAHGNDHKKLEGVAHLTSAQLLRRIQRVGMKSKATRFGSVGVFALPVIPNLVVSHQWARELRRWGRGRPRARPDSLIADKGYSHARRRRLLRERPIKHIIPERRDQRARRAMRRGRPLLFNQAIYS
jgi:hypothetical protein